MALLWICFPIIPLVFAAYEDAYKVAYDTALQTKCEGLKLKYDAAYVGDRCFVVTRESYKIPLSKFKSLSDKCTHMYGYHAKLGNVYTEKQIDVFLDSNLLENNKKYFVGAMQSPTDIESNRVCCAPQGHNLDWFYLGDDGNVTNKPVNSQLWIKGQPDDQGKGNGEYALAIEKLQDTNKLGYNDVNPDDDGYQVLCEYVDFQVCKTNWTLIGSICYRVFTEPLTVDDAKTQCNTEGGPKGRLASIHEDRVNQLLAYIARETFDYQRISNSGELSHNPVIFGLSFDGGKWNYDNQDPVDFFRWYDQAGNTLPSTGQPILLNTLNSGTQGEARYTYWTVGQRGGRYPYVCQTEPDIN